MGSRHRAIAVASRRKNKGDTYVGGGNEQDQGKVHGRGTTDPISHTTEDLGVKPVEYAPGIDPFICQRSGTLSQHETL
jgi:hypothetical protein